jgi:lipoprotein-anchoring transpeptidase ErfK/SrfK
MAAHMRRVSVLGAVVVVVGGFSAQPIATQPASRQALTKASLTVPADSETVAVAAATKKYAGAKILVSTRARMLYFVLGRDTLLSAPVAIGVGKDFQYKDKKYHFATPRGRRSVLKKEENPIWVVPDWHYYEKATLKGIEAVHLEPGEVYPLNDGSWIQLRGDQVGRVNLFGNFWPFTPGIEIIFDGKLFIPPMNSAQRRVPDALGPVKLDTGNGYLIHGTHEYTEDSIGQAASHGCVRMRNEDLLRLYRMVEPGTPVIIY